MCCPLCRRTAARSSSLWQTPPLWLCCAGAGLGDPLELASRIRGEIVAATHCTGAESALTASRSSGVGKGACLPARLAVDDCPRFPTPHAASAGIGPNLLLARIATEQAKPDGQRMVTQQEAADFLRALPVDRLPGVGWSTGRRLAELGIHSVADVQVGAGVRLECGRCAERLPCQALPALFVVARRRLPPEMQVPGSKQRLFVACSVQASSKQTLQGQLGEKLGAVLWDFAHGRDRRQAVAEVRVSVQPICHFAI